MTFTLLDRMDAQVHRCTGCGAWVYGRRVCATPTCVIVTPPAGVAPSSTGLNNRGTTVPAPGVAA